MIKVGLTQLLPVSTARRLRITSASEERNKHVRAGITKCGNTATLMSPVIVATTNKSLCFYLVSVSVH